MTSGATPAVANDTSRPSGSRPSRAARSPSITTMAAAPSLICELFPAVTVPVGSKAGRRPAMRDSSVSRRIPSSASKRTISRWGRPSSTTVRSTSTGTISSRNQPASWAVAARWWLRSPQASWASRSTPSRRATSSPVRPMPR